MQILPIGRVKRIIKMESDVKAVSAEASYAVARATVCHFPCTAISQGSCKRRAYAAIEGLRAVSHACGRLESASTDVLKVPKPGTSGGSQEFVG